MFIYLHPYLPKRMTDYFSRRKLCAKFHNLSLGENYKIFDSTFGNNVNVSSDVTIVNSHIGDFSYIGPGSVICGAELGKYCSVAPGSYIGMGSHPSHFVSTHPLFYLSRPAHGWTIADRDYLNEFARTKIGNDVWLGLRVAIKDGISIGDGAIIGAGAVVVKDVPPYSIYGGVPAKFIGTRFNKSEIEFLLSFKWWDKSAQWLRENYKKFHNINDFIRDFST